MFFRRSIICSTITALLAASSTSALAKSGQSDTSTKTQALQTIVVIGNKHQHTSAPSGNSQMLFASDFSPSVRNLSELIADTPGAELSGQGGLFQVYALRGMSRWRVLTQVAGVPVHTERRAGTAASFISPWLVGQTEIVKGPVSTLYGSGGLAGIAQIQPRQFHGLNLQTGFSSNGDVQFENLGWGNEQYSLGISHQTEKNGQTPSGDAINSHFEQTSTSFLGHWQFDEDIESRLMLLYGNGNDIGKANNEDFSNKKYTTYPDENHLMAQFALEKRDEWQANFSLHQHDLLTQTIRFGQRINSATAKANDYSLNFSKNWQWQAFQGRWGVEQEYRDNIHASERELNLKSDVVATSEFLDAEQYSAALFAFANYQLNDWAFSLGGRYSYIKQSSHFDQPQHQDRSDSKATYFASAAYQLDDNWQLTSSLSTGFRFPSVSERFYNGMTARGQTFGNPQLQSETAQNIEFGFNYHNDNIKWLMSAFNNDIDHYIERIDMPDDTRTYRNLDKGTIKGVEFGFNHQLSDSFSYELSGHHLKGRDINGDAIADISPNKLQLALNYDHQQWQAQLRIKHRFSHRSVASGEQPLDSVNIVTGHIDYYLSDSWQLTLWADNLLNKEYAVTSDDKSALSNERRFGVTLSWSME